MTPLLLNNDPAMPPIPNLELRPNACSTYYAPPPLAYENQPPHPPHQHHNHPYMNIGAQKKTDLIDRLVETSAEIIDSIWSQQQSTPLSSPDPHMKVVHTKAFIQEILRRSKTTYSNLQVCLFYLFRIKKAVLMRIMDIQKEDKKKSRDDHILCCGRRMFLAALMVSAKFLQDKNYRNRAWARLSGLALHEINAAEMLFLRLINYNLYISQSTFDQWHSLLQAYLYRQSYQQQQHHHHHHSSCGNSINITGSNETCLTCYLRTISSHSTPFPSCLPPSNHQHRHTAAAVPFRADRRQSSYPSPPLTGELNSATLTPSPSPPLVTNTHSSGSSRSSNKRSLEHNNDQECHVLSIKRHCIDFN